jgi:hypothetical protein
MLGLGQLRLNILGETVDDPGSPAFSSLAGQDVAADRPVKQDQLAVDGECSPDLGRTYAALELLEQFGIAGRWGEGLRHKEN